MTKLLTTLCLLWLCAHTIQAQSDTTKLKEELHLSGGMAFPQLSPGISLELGYMDKHFGLNTLIGTTIGKKTYQTVMVGMRYRIPVTKNLTTDIDLRIGTYRTGMLVNVSGKVSYKKAFIAYDTFINPRRSLQTGVRVGYIFPL
jgi:hypothetical protein